MRRRKFPHFIFGTEKKCFKIFVCFYFLFLFVSVCFYFTSFLLSVLKMTSNKNNANKWRQIQTRQINDVKYKKKQKHIFATYFHVNNINNVTLASECTRTRVWVEIGPPPRLGTMPVAGGTPRKFFRHLNGQTIIYLTIIIIYLSLQKSNDDETNIIPCINRTKYYC